MSVRAYSQQVREEEWEVGMVGVGGGSCFCTFIYLISC